MGEFGFYPCVIVHGDTVKGDIVYYDDSKTFDNATRENVRKLFSEIYEAIDDEFHHYYELEVKRANTIGDLKEIHRFVHRCFDTETVDTRFRELMYKEKRNISTAFNMAIDEYLIEKPKILLSEFKKDKRYIKETFRYLRKRLSIRFEMITLKKLTQRKKSNFILVANKFKKEYFFELSKFVTGIIFKRNDNESLSRTLASEYEVTIATHNGKYRDKDRVVIDSRNRGIVYNPTTFQVREYNKVIAETTYKIGEEASYKKSNIKIYAPMNDIRLIDRISEGNWYSGVAPYKSEYIFVTKGTPVSLKKQSEIFQKLLLSMDEGEVYIRIPDFRPERPTEYLRKNIYTDIDSYYEFLEIFEDNIGAIGDAARKTGRMVNVVIPMIRTNEEINVWRKIIETEFMGAEKLVNVGIMIETESAMDYHEEYVDMDFAIIDLNDMIEEITDDYDRFSLLTKEEILEIFWPELRDVHQHLRADKTKMIHIISGNFVSNPELFSKFLVSGFRNYSIPSNKIKLIEGVLRNYIETRGYYIGVAGERKRRKIYRAMYPETKEIVIENDIMRENSAKKQLRRIANEYKKIEMDRKNREKKLELIIEERMKGKYEKKK